MSEHTRFAAIGGLLVLSLAVSGCSSDADVRDTAGPNPFGIEPLPVPGCESESYTACDVETDACQDEIFSTVACLRGSQGAVRPKSRTITVDDYRAELVASVELDQSETEEGLYALERCLVLLDLANVGDLTDEGVVEVQTSTVPAYYDSDSKTVNFVHWEGRSGLYLMEASHIVLAHEYVHALQDQEYDLNRLYREHTATIDGTLALRSVIEGEAKLQEDAFLAAAWGLDLQQLDVGERYDNQQRLDDRALAGYSPILAIGRSFPYAAGGPYVRQIFERGGMAEVRGLYDHVPTSTLEISTGIESIPVVADPPAAPAGYALLGVDTFGSELFLDFLSTTFANSTTNLTPFATDWRGDRAYLFHKPGTEYVAVVWRLKLATESLRTLLLEPSRPWQSRLVDGDVLVALTTDSDPASVASVLLDNAAQGNTIAPSDLPNEPSQAASLLRWPSFESRDSSRRPILR